jgi:hypothetical protein
MQARKTKEERKASRITRNEARRFKFGQLAADRVLNRAIKREAAIARESVKRTAASPAAISLTKTTYEEQCARHRAWKRGEDVSNG